MRLPLPPLRAALESSIAPQLFLCLRTCDRLPVAQLYGGCVHHDNGPLGAMAIDRAEERRVELLKQLGYNAIRTSHNPVSPAFLDACDRLGMLVMDEAFDCWAQGKNPQDYHLYFDEWWRRDILALVLRDRNHPSVIMWSIGNEIPMRFTQTGTNLSAIMRDYVHSLNPGSNRAVTSAYPLIHEQDSPFLHNMEVAGYNYAGVGVSRDRTRQRTSIALARVRRHGCLIVRADLRGGSQAPPVEGVRGHGECGG